MADAAQKPKGADTPVGIVLTDDHRMLLNIRDTLYEGSWSDFRHDLEARCNEKPHVFETVPESPHMLKVIRYHLQLIAQMSDWELNCGAILRGNMEA